MDGVTVGKVLLVIGILVALAGGWLASGRSLPFGSLPGDMSVSNGSFSFSFPIVSCIVLSLLVTVIVNIIIRR